MTIAERSQVRAKRLSSAGARALEAFTYGRYQDVLSLLGQAPVDDAALEIIRVQTLVRLGRHVDALATLRGHQDRFWDRSLPLAKALGGIAMIRSGADTDGATQIAAAYASLGSATPRDVAAEVIYYAAQSAWVSRDLNRASLLAKEVLPTAGMSYVRTLDLLGFIASANEDLITASRYHSSALSEYSKCSDRDEFVHGQLIAQVLSLAVELLDTFLTSQAEDSLKHIEWADGMTRQRHLVDFYRGKLALIRGDAAAAYSYFEACADPRNNQADRGMAFLELSTLERSLGEPFAAQRWYEKAAETASSVTWSDADADQRMTLLTLCDAASSIGDMAGSGPLIRYLSTAPAKGKPTAFSDDARRTAFEYKARGHVARLQSRNKEAQEWFGRAYEEFRRLRMRFRCVTVAVEMAKAGDLKFAHEIDDFEKQFPRSLIAPATNASASTEVSTDSANLQSTALSERTLGKAEQRVYQLICEGKSTSAIAVELGKSTNTISNQTRRIFKRFGVRSRAALIVAHTRQTQRERAS